MKRITVVLVLLLLILGGFIFWWFNGQSPVNPLDSKKQSFIIRPGQGIRDIAYNLKQQGLIRSPVVFFLSVKQQNLDGKIQAGNFQIAPSESTYEIAQALTHGTTDIWVTITEGKRAEEVAELLATKLPNYDNSWKQQLIANEGYLFPDTYLFPINANVNDVITIMKNNFNKKYAEAAENQTAKLTEPEVVTLASIVEREAITPTDMQGVASVLENRLALGMALGSDVTVEYVLGYQPAEKTWWKKDLTADDLAIASPYNTRINPGLPPGPISNPGLNALSAVLHPADTNYLYFIADSTGKVHFAQTLQQHNANVEKYLH